MSLRNPRAGVRGRAGSILRGIRDRLLLYAERYLKISAVFYRLWVVTFTGPPYFRIIFREMVKQVYFTAVQGGYILIFAALMLGMQIILNANEQLVKVRYEDFLGWLLVTIVIRELGPVLAGFFVLVHSAGPITVEIGTMSVTREVDALQVMGVDPYRYLGVPRFWGVTVSVVCLYLVTAHAAVLGGYLFSRLYADISWTNFRNLFINALQWVDLLVGLIKAAMFGMIISTVAIFAGFEAHGDLGEVAKKTAQGALWSLVLCGAMDIIITTAYYLYSPSRPRFPLGGLERLTSFGLC
uniref:ABC transporter permease n=1 Tax=Desulfobacca acetoxidans TaxID=60893 RepID=A0A7C3UZ99_9BACT